MNPVGTQKQLAATSRALIIFTEERRQIAASKTAISVFAQGKALLLQHKERSLVRKAAVASLNNSLAAERAYCQHTAATSAATMAT